MSLHLKEEKVPPGTSGPHVSTWPMPPGQPVPWAPATWGGSGWDQEGLRGEWRARWGWRGQGAAQWGGQVPGERSRMARLCLEPGPWGRARRELPEWPCGASPQGSAGKGSVTRRGHAGEEPGRKGQTQLLHRGGKELFHAGQQEGQTPASQEPLDAPQTETQQWTHTGCRAAP